MTYPLEFKTQGSTSYINFNQLYTSNGIKDIVKRQCEYLREHPYSNSKKILVPVLWITAGGIIGLEVATKVADHFRLQAGKRQAAQGGGIVIGCAGGAYLYIHSNERNLFFKTWKTLRLESITNSYIFAKHENDLFLSKFIDCIHYTPLKVPVRLASGHLIDLDTLKKIQPDGNGDILCPHTREKLDLNNPNVDLEIHLLIMKRIQFLLQQDLIKLDPTSEDYHATELQLEFIESRLVSVHSLHLKGLDQLRSKGKITEIELNHLKNQFYTHFGADPIGSADTKNEYDAHTMNFALDWKKFFKQQSKLLFKGTPPTKFMEEI